jgi:hypothetical protein
MMRRLLPTLLAMLALAGPPAALAEQSATVLRDTELRAEPFSDARSIAALKARSTITILERRGGWYQARHGAQSGWVRMSAIRMGKAMGGSSGISETLQFLSTGRSDASGVTVATGIRGLDAADVANATPNHQAVRRLERFQVSAAQARSFAANAQLQSNRMDYLKPGAAGRQQ